MEPPKILAFVLLAVGLLTVHATPLDGTDLPVSPLVREANGGDHLPVEAIVTLYRVFRDHRVSDVAASYVGRDDGVGVGGDLYLRSRCASDAEVVWDFLFHPSSGGAAVVAEILAPFRINLEGQTPVVCVLLPQVPTLGAVPLVLAYA